MIESKHVGLAKRRSNDLMQDTGRAMCSPPVFLQARNVRETRLTRDEDERKSSTGSRADCQREDSPAAGNFKKKKKNAPLPLFQ